MHESFYFYYFCTHVNPYQNLTVIEIVVYNLTAVIGL